MIQSQTPIVCISNSGQPCLIDRRIISELESSSCICISTNNSDTLCSSQGMSVLVQNSSYCSSLAPMSVDLKVLQLLISAPILLPLFKKLLTQSKGKFLCPNFPLLDLHAWELSSNQLEIKKISKKVADFVSKSRRTSTQKVYDSKWVVYSNLCHRKNVNPISAPLTVIADFIIYLFS